MREFAHHKPGLVRLNNGSFGSCPASVLAAQADWCRWWLRQPDECYFGPLEEHLYQARKEVADLIHVHVEEVVLLENVTAAASMVALDVMWAFAEGLFSKGDSILTLNFNYGAVKKAFKVRNFRSSYLLCLLCTRMKGGFDISDVLECQGPSCKLGSHNFVHLNVGGLRMFNVRLQCFRLLSYVFETFDNPQNPIT